jgi:DNA-binding GntR family transcriptional regulator
VPKTTNVSLEVMRSFTLSHTSTVPLYSQLAQQLEQAIDQGSLPHGMLLLNEIELAEALDLSQPTIRRAIQTLAQKGLVVRRRGIGTRVVQPRTQRPFEVTSLHDDLARSGKKPSTEVLSFTMRPASQRIAELLAIDEGDEVLELVRLRLAGSEPIAVLTNFLPAWVVQFSEEDLVERGLYDLIRSQGTTLDSAHQMIGARTASPEETMLLDEPLGAALLTMERVTYDGHGKVVEFGHHLYAASRYTFEIDLTPV